MLVEAPSDIYVDAGPMHVHVHCDAYGVLFEAPLVAGRGGGATAQAVFSDQGCTLTINIRHGICRADLVDLAARAQLTAGYGGSPREAVQDLYYWRYQ